MKKSEKLFLAINDINDEIIENAKPKEEKPVILKPAPRSPIKGVMLLAACIAVLAVGIFAIVKFKTGGDIDPIDSDSISSSEEGGDSSDNSTESDSSSDSSYFPDPDVELTFTEEDLELQKILKDLVANAEEIDRMFNYMSIMEKEPDLKIGSQSDDYYLITDDVKTEPNGLHSVPQTCEEMEMLIRRYFSSRAAKSYIQQISKGAVIRVAGGSTELKLENENGYGIFVEADGKMYRSYFYRDWTGTNLGINVKTAKVISKTDRSIEFSYWGYDYAFDYDYDDDDGSVYAERRGALVNEDGVWKIHYFCYDGFVPQIPAEYTEQDLELQEILADLAPEGELIANWIGYGCDGPYYKFYINGDEYADLFNLLPIGKTPDGKMEYPQTLEELEELMLQYLTQELVDNNMKGACKGTMTENPDGTYSVSVVEGNTYYCNFIEIDGRIYVLCPQRGGEVGSPVWDTAKIIEKTEDHIKFSYTHCDIGGYHPDEGLIKYERGGWRLSYSWRGFVLD